MNQIVPSRVDDDVVRRVERQTGERVDDGLGLAGSAIDGADRGPARERALLADEQPSVGRERHPVRAVRVLAHGRDADRLEAVELEAADRARLAAERAAS